MKNLTFNFYQYVSLNVLGMIGLSCYILADTFFVAQALGATGLAALNFSLSVFSIMQGLGLMIGIGGGADFSLRQHETNDTKHASAFVHSLILGACASFIFVMIALFFTGPLSTLLGADEVTLPLTKTYLSTVLSFSPFFILNNILVAFTRNDHNPRLPMIAMLVSSLSNVILDYLFIFPLSMGIFGAALATGLSPIISLCILSFHFTRKKNTFHLTRCKIRISKIFTILSLGFSSFIGELASAISLITFNLIILKINGNTGVAAYGIIANIAFIATAVFTGIAQGIQPLASKCYGKKELLSVRLVLRYALVTTFIFFVAIYACLFFFSGTIVAVFNSEKNLLLAEIANEGVRIYFIGYLFAGINIVSAAFLSAIAHYKQAMILSLARSCILLVPMVFLLSLLSGMEGVWFSFVLTELLVFLLNALFLHRVSKTFTITPAEIA